MERDPSEAAMTILIAGLLCLAAVVIGCLVSYGLYYDKTM